LQKFSKIMLLAFTIYIILCLVIAYEEWVDFRSIRYAIIAFIVAFIATPLGAWLFYRS